MSAPSQTDVAYGAIEPGGNFSFEYAPKRLIGRDEYLGRLDAALNDPGTHVVTLVAWGGVGKTSLVVHWMAQLAQRNWPGLDHVFAWSFYSQGTRDQGGASADDFVKAALDFFGDAELAGSATAARAKGQSIARRAAKHRTLLVLDGLEPLQHPPGPLHLEGRLQDPAIEALLVTLAQLRRTAAAGTFCVVTTRESVTDLRGVQATTAPEWKLEHLTPEAGAAVLWNAGAKRAGGQELKGASDYELKDASVEVGGHALTLQLLGSYLSRAHRGDIRKRSLVRLDKADAAVQGGHAFRVMAAYERWLAQSGEEGARQLAVLRLLGLFDRPADPSCLAALREPPAIPGLTEPLAGLGEEEWNLVVIRARIRWSREDRGVGAETGEGVWARTGANGTDVPIGGARGIHAAVRFAPRGCARRASALATTLRQTAARHGCERVARRPPAALRVSEGERALLAGRSRWPAAALPGGSARL